MVWGFNLQLCCLLFTAFATVSMSTFPCKYNQCNASYCLYFCSLKFFFPFVLTGHAGTRYGISFPVLVRSSFGINGAHVPTLIRALIGCGWYGIESWIGGEAIFLLLPKAMKEATSLSQSLPWLGTSPLEFACFLVFWVAQLAFVWKGIDGIRKLEKYSAPILVALTSCLLIWSCVKE